MAKKGVKSANKRVYKKPTGPGTANGETGIETRFSSTNQPSGEAKSNGHKKKRMLKDMLELAFKGPKGGKIKKAAAQYLGIPEDEITVEDMMHFRQIERAIAKQNTFAYMAVMDRAFGKPASTLDDDGEGLSIKVTVKRGANAHNKH